MKFESDSLYVDILRFMRLPLLSDFEIRHQINDTDDGRFELEATLVVHYDLGNLKRARKLSCTIATFDTRADALAYAETLISLIDYEQLKLFVKKYNELHNLNIDDNYGEW